MNVNSSLRLVALCAALALVGCSSKADRITSGLEKGAEYVSLSDWDKAGVETRNVLQIDPKNAQAYYLSAQIAEGKGEIPRAFASFSKAVELKPDHLEAKVGMARLFLLAGRLDESEKAIAETLSAKPDHVGALTLRAALEAGRGNTTGAITQARALFDAQKTPPIDTAMLLAGLYSSQGKADEALGIIDKTLQAHPQSLALMQIGAQIAGGSSDPAAQQKAVGYLRAATERAPKNIAVWNQWAGWHLQRKEIDRAEEVLRASVKAQPDDSQRTLALLDVIATYRGRDVAEKEYLAAIADKPKNANLRFGLVKLYRASNRTADARRVLQEVIDHGNDDAPSALIARNQLAADLFAAGQVAQARSLVAEVLKANPRDNAALVTRGRILLADNNPRDAVIDLRAAFKDQPGSPEIAALLAQAHRQAGEPQLAREVLADAVKFAPSNADLRLLLAADMADTKEWEAANAEIDNAIRLAPQNLRAYDMKAKIALAQKNLPAAEAVYASLKTRYPNDPTGAIKLGQLYAEQKKYDAALREFDAAAKLAPQAAAPVMSSIGILVTQKRFDEAGKRIDAIAAQNPQSDVPYRLRAEVATARGDLPGAEQSYIKLIEFSPTAPAGYYGLARVKAQRGDIANAITVIEQGEKKNPNETSLPATRAEWLARSGRNDEAIAVYEDLLKRSPGDPSYTNNLAYLLSVKGDTASLERALALVMPFNESSNAGYLDTLGWTQYKLGRYDESAVVLERAVQRAPEGALYQLHLGLALHKKGDKERAQPLLQKGVRGAPAVAEAAEARKLLAMK